MMEEANAMNAKRPRKANWSSREIDTLVEMVSENSFILNASFSGTITHKRKSAIWQNVADRLNSIGDVRRDIEEVKKKWADIKSKTKKKASLQKVERHRTGGGPPPASLTDQELKIVSTIPTCQIEGCEGGLESEVVSLAIQSTSATNNINYSSQPSPAETMESTYFEPVELFTSANTSPTDTSDCINIEGDMFTFQSTGTSAFKTTTKRKSSRQPSPSASETRLERMCVIEEEKLAVLKDIRNIMQQRLNIEEEKLLLKKSCSLVDY